MSKPQDVPLTQGETKPDGSVVVVVYLSDEKLFAGDVLALLSLVNQFGLQGRELQDVHKCRAEAESTTRVELTFGPRPAEGRGGGD